MHAWELGLNAEGHSKLLSTCILSFFSSWKTECCLSESGLNFPVSTSCYSSAFQLKEISQHFIFQVYIFTAGFGLNCGLLKIMFYIQHVCTVPYASLCMFCVFLCRPVIMKSDFFYDILNLELICILVYIEALPHNLFIFLYLQKFGHSVIESTLESDHI